MKKIERIIGLALLVFVAACSNSGSHQSSTEGEDVQYELVLKSEVKWDHLNPKRGDLAPKAGTLWGDRKGTEPTGFLLKPTDGFSSPAHIHNVSYRGVVISGVIHNDDPDAGEMWMPSGSFWTQPKGHVHITSAETDSTLAYIEIEEGPYLVLPPEDHFDSGERPINVDETNIVWLGASDIVWVPQNKDANDSATAKVAFLWGEREEGKLSGTLIKLPAGFEGTISNIGSSFRAVLINGEPEYNSPLQNKPQLLEAGSYFGSTKGGKHHIRSNSNKETILYVRSHGFYDIVLQKH